nr:DUF4350 domain-containing protein [Neobacillus terrae]
MNPSIWLVLLFALFIVSSIFSFSPKPKDYPRYVSNSPAPDGVKAIYTYLKDEQGMKTWAQVPQILPQSAKGNLLIMIEPFFMPEKEDMQAYLKFLKAGNTILLFKENPKGMFDLKTNPFGTSKPVTKLYDNKNHSFRGEISSPIRLLANKEDTILLRDERGTVAIERKVGKGKLIVNIAPEWMTNREIVKQDHLPLVLNLLKESRSETILLDEYIHGEQNAPRYLSVFPKWFLLLLLQGILILVFWLWQSGKRFGPIFIPREETVRFSDEGIQALTAWYLRGRRYHDSLLIQADYVKLLLQEAWGIPYSWEWNDLTGHLDRKWLNQPEAEIRTFLQGLTAILAKEDVSKQEYLQWSQNLNRLRKEVEEG